jgi:hypothetical protein
VNNLLGNITNIFSQITKVIFVITVVLAPINSSFAKEKSDYELQSEIIFNFINYVSWSEVSSEIIKVKNLCIMEDNPVIPYLNILLENKNEKRIVVMRKHENDYLEDCHILFINDNYDGYLSRLLARVKGKPILTFGNVKNFAESGGIVQFRLRSNRVEFIVNTKEMRSSQVRISDFILSVSETIN